MKYHMIRKNLTYMIGPLNEVKLRAYLTSSEVDQNDEIAGSCGKWVRLGDTSRLQKYYPHTYKFIDARSKNWNMSIHSGVPTVLEAKLSWKRFILPVFTVLFLIAAGFFAWQYRDVLLKAGSSHAHDPYALAVKKYDKNRFQSLVHDIDLEIEAWKDLEVDQLLQRQELWLPLIRSSAFASSALASRYASILPEIPSLPLLGKCQVSNLKTIISADDLSDTFAKPFSRDSHISRLLLWDPHWIKRRKEMGWGKPQNRYEACLIKTKRALESLPSNTMHNQILLRVNQMLSILGSAFAKVSPPKYQSGVVLRSFWGVLSCIEGASDKKSLIACNKDGFEKHQVAYLSWRGDFRLAWLEAMQGVPPQKLKRLLSSMQEIQTLPHVYQAELKFLQKLEVGTDLPQAVEAAEALDENFRL